MLDNFWVKLIGVAVVVYTLYFAISPYQNCLRSEGDYNDYIALFLKISHTPPPPPGFIPLGADTEEEWRRDLKMRCIRVAAW